MKLSLVYSRSSTGISAPLVTVETHISRGFPGFHIVGLPETVVKESKDRVRSALLNNGFEFPRRRITVNLAPADLPKEGARFDLPIALGILAASNQISKDKLSESEFTGELALSGELRPVRGVLPMAISLKQTGRNLIVPTLNASEAGIVKETNAYFAGHLLEVCAFLRGERALEKCPFKEQTSETAFLDLSEVKGQQHAKRALEVAAAGKHSILFMGPPGTGKTMLATRLPGISIPLNENQALEVAAILSVSNQGFDSTRWRQIPFRSPHHTSSSIALVGGGRPPRPGEISLAHHGILFLDELPEFNRQVLESLREPLESGHITISRAAYQTVFPAKFQLIAAMNPCPCGYAGSLTKECLCTHEQVQRYMAKLSGPLLDRIDLHVHVPALPTDVLVKQPQAETSHVIMQRVIHACDRQLKRQSKCNAYLSVSEIQSYCQLNAASEKLLSQVMQKFNFSARVYHRILKLSRTIADLANSDLIDTEHLSEAISYRGFDPSRP